MTILNKLTVLFLLLFFSAGAVAQERNLDFYLERAKNASPLLKDLNNQLMLTKIDSMRLRAGYLPQISASSTGAYAPVIKGWGYDVALSNGQALDALLNVNYQLVKKNIVNNQIQGLKIHSDSVRVAARISELDLNKAIIEQFITAYASQEQITFNQEVTDLLRSEEAVLKKLTRANIYKQTDYLTFLITLQQQELQLNQARIQYQNDYYTLNYLSGIGDTAKANLSKPEINAGAVTTIDNSIYLRNFSLDSLRMITERNAIDFSYRPKASIYANAGYNSSFILQPYKNFGTSYGFTIAVPIYDGHQRKMQYDQLNLRESTRARYRDFFINQYTQQVSMLNRQIAERRTLTSKIKEQVRLAKSLIDVDSKLLQTGDVTVNDFVIAVNNYLAAQNLSRQTNIELLKLINQLNYWNK